MQLLACGGLVGLALLMATPAAAATFGQATADAPLFEISSPLSPLVAENSSDTSVIVDLTLARTDPAQPTLGLRGRSVSRTEPDAFSVETNILRVPCPGEYRFHVATEDTSNGNSSSSSALLKLFSPTVQPPGARCGGAPPPRAGRMNVRLEGQKDTLFAIDGRRYNAGAFEGDLSLDSVPDCDRTYTLGTVLDLAGWSRSIEFKVRAIALNSTLPGRAAEDKRC